MPQIELMMADLPHTLYNYKGDKDVRQDDIDEATRLTIEAYERKKKSMDSKEYTIDDVFKGIDENE